MVDNNKCLQLSLILPVFILPVTTFAQSSYLFPSDITDQPDQSEQMQTDTNRVQHYKTQRKWFYPDEKSINQQNQYPSQQNAYEKSSENIDYPRSEHYKYDSFSQKKPVVPEYQRTEADMNRQSQPQAQYWTRSEYPSNENYRAPRREIYVSDLIKKPKGQAKRFFPEKNDIRQGSRRLQPPLKEVPDRGKQNPDQVRTQIRYIPVPVYTYAMPPGILPGTVPGIVTPVNIVPGYPHLSPGFNSYGAAPLSLYPWGSQGNISANPYNMMFQNYGSNSGSNYDNNYGNNNGTNNSNLFPYNPANIPANNTVPGFSGVPELFSR